MNCWRVMTVDDSAAILTIIATYLEGTEFEVVAAEREGEAAVERFVEVRPDIVLLDLMMPGISGAETLARILAVDPDAVVVIVSSVGADQAVGECLATGARTSLRKPFAKQDFIRFMRELTKAA